MKFNFMKETKKKENCIQCDFLFLSKSLIFFLYIIKKSNSVVFRKNHLKFKEWRPLFGNKRHITWVKLVWKVYMKKKGKTKQGKKTKEYHLSIL